MAHWLLSRNPAHLKTEQQICLDDVLAANLSLMTVGVMKAQLKALWTATAALGWRSAWKQWAAHAQQSGIPALIQFAGALEGYRRGIVSHGRWPIHAGQLPGHQQQELFLREPADLCLPRDRHTIHE